MKRTDLALAALASAAVPGMKPVGVAGIRPAPDDVAPDVQEAVVEDATGRRWLVRSPLNPVAGARLERNDELVRQVARHLPFKAPAAVGYASLGRDGLAAVYPHVDGHPVDFSRLPGGTGVSTAVGRALAAVHNIPREVFEEQDVPVYDAAGCRQRAIGELDRAAETGRVPTALLARWEEAFEAAPLWQFATVPVHGSIRSGTVIVAFADEEDAASGRVVALSRWEDAMVGDPAVDLARLFAEAPAGGWEAVVESYGLARAQRPDPYLAVRARLLSETRQVRGLAQAVADGRDDEVRRTVELLRRMDRLTEDDSLVPATARRSAAHQVAPATPTAAVGGAVARADQAQDEDAADVTETWDTRGEQQAEGLPGSAAEELQEVADLGWADEDMTTEVPVVRAEDAPDPTEGPTVRADDGADAWGPDTSEGGTGGTEAAAGGTNTDADGTDANTVGSEPGPVDQLDADDRLQELYGMPSAEDTDRR